MNLDHITATVACPECGCTEIRKMEKANKHSNGQWNERLKFGCGLELHYSPNMGGINTENDCTKSPKAAEWRARRAVLAGLMTETLVRETGADAKKLESFARSLAVDLDLYRDELLRHQ